MARRHTYRQFRDVRGNPVRLSLARWRHIRRRHPEISEDVIAQTLVQPDEIRGAALDRLYLRSFGSSQCIVAVRNTRGMYIRTAYLARTASPTIGKTKSDSP